MIYHLKGSLASFAHTGGLRYTDVFPAPPACHIAPGGMDLGRGGDVVPVRLRPRYVTAQRETLALPWRSGYSDTSSPRSFRARAGFYGQLAWFWLSDVPFFLLPVRQCERLQSLVLSLPLADFIASADCSSWELRLRQPTVLGGTDVSVAPGGECHYRLFLSC
jgi:hypothetical protein